MVNIALIIISIVVFCLLIAISIYIVFYFQHEEDKNVAYFPKIVVVSGLTLCFTTILMLPLDVGNTRTNGGFPMQILWTIDLILVVVYGFIIIPFTIFFYEAEEEGKGVSYQLKQALKWESIVLTIFVIITIVLWIFIGIVEIPTTSLSSGLESGKLGFQSSCPNCARIEPNENFLNYRISFPLYLISTLTFGGIFLFILFGGIGLTGIPMDLFSYFKNRPKLISKLIYDEEKKKISSRSKNLLQKGTNLKNDFGTSGRPTSRRQKARYNEFKSQVYLLEEDWNFLQKSYGRGFGPRLFQIILGWISLPLGIITSGISIIWFLHMVIFVVANINPFLNTMFIEMDNVFPLFGTIAYGVVSFYLLWCVVKGNFKFGLRIPLLMTIHPMK